MNAATEQRAPTMLGILYRRVLKQSSVSGCSLLRFGVSHLPIHLPVKSPPMVLPIVEGIRYDPASPVLASLKTWKYIGTTNIIWNSLAIDSHSKSLTGLTHQHDG